MRRTRIGCAVFALWVVTSTAWADDPAVKGTAALEGTWSFLSWELEGEKAPAATIKNFRWIFRGNQAVWSSGFIPEQKLTREEKYTIETDPNKSPKWITFTSLDTKGKDLGRG